MNSLLNIGLKTMRYFLVACMALITLLVFSNVVMRYIFSSSIYIAEGFSSLLFVWLTFVGAALVLYERGLIAVDILTRRLSSFNRAILDILVDCLMLAVAILFLKGSWHQTILNMNVISSSTLLPSSLLYAAGIFFSIASGAFLTLQIIKTLISIVGSKSSALKY
ncbi:TRAP transporter small permease [Halomonas citrativorans]|uniref:TRAP transporter small permease n=1 Tax=Halomonas citrativorans TaxID=2742612 RepID=UPI000B360FD9|nr:TRAP transporter small permease [Halomonas citrativorans]